MNPAVSLADAQDERRFGGKSASLARAIRAGLPVPPGVALAVDVVDALVSGEEHVVRELRDVVAGLGGSVAVRSSAVGEDDQQTSFAGQHSTVLNVRTDEALLDAVHEVFRSAHSVSALAYRERMGVAREVRMGVAVQQLVHAEAAGVLFTQNPVTGADECLIEAAWGLGEAVVSGIVVPDAYRIAVDGRVLERIPGEKHVELRPGSDGGIEELAVSPERVRALCLRDDHLEALHRLTQSCESQYGRRLDIEWALAHDRIYLLQCRAITR